MSELSYLGADAVFGENGFLNGATRDTDAVADGDVQVEFLRRNEFLAILSVQPHLLSPTFEPVFNLSGAIFPSKRKTGLSWCVIAAVITGRR